MQDQRSEVIDFKGAVDKRTSRTARWLFLETMRIRRPIPRLPRFGRAAAVLVETSGTLTFWARPDLDDIDVKIAAYGFALRFTRFDRADAIRSRTLRAARAHVDRQADPEAYVEQPPRDLPVLRMNDPYQVDAVREAIEQLAREVLARAEITRPPVDIDAVAASVGMRFISAGFDQDVLLGAYCSDPPYHWRLRLPFALISSHQHPLRQRFTKAHELAHHLIDEPRGWVARLALPLPQGPCALDYHPVHEFFAASLLMPRPWVDRFDCGSWRRRDVARFAREFGVTQIAAAVRLEEIYGRPRHDIVPASVPAGELTGLYAQA